MYKRNHISSVCMRHIQIKHFHVSIGVESRWTNQQITNKNDDWHVPSCFGPQCYFRPGHSCEIIHAGYAALESLSRLNISAILFPKALKSPRREKGKWFNHWDKCTKDPSPGPGTSICALCLYYILFPNSVWLTSIYFVRRGCVRLWVSASTARPWRARWPPSSVKKQILFVLLLANNSSQCITWVWFSYDSELLNTEHRVKSWGNILSPGKRDGGGHVSDSFAGNVNSSTIYSIQEKNPIFNIKLTWHIRLLGESNT